MNETIKLLMERKSVRQFVQEEMPREDVEAILNAAVQAPSAGNMTLWTIINVTDPEKKAALAKSCDNQPFIATAPLVLVFCADYRRWFEVFKTLDLGEELRVPATGDFMLATADTIIAAHATVVAADALGRCSSSSGWEKISAIPLKMLTPPAPRAERKIARKETTVLSMDQIRTLRTLEAISVAVSVGRENIR